MKKLKVKLTPLNEQKGTELVPFRAKKMKVKLTPLNEQKEQLNEVEPITTTAVGLATIGGWAAAIVGPLAAIGLYNYWYDNEDPGAGGVSIACGTTYGQFKKEIHSYLYRQREKHIKAIEDELAAFKLNSLKQEIYDKLKAQAKKDTTALWLKLIAKVDKTYKANSNVTKCANLHQTFRNAMKGMVRVYSKKWGWGGYVRWFRPVQRAQLYYWVYCEESLKKLVAEFDVEKRKKIALKGVSPRPTTTGVPLAKRRVKTKVLAPAGVAAAYKVCRGLPLKRGCKGTAVESIQKTLIKLDLGRLLGHYQADGFFGSRTENAVKKFQTDKGVRPVTGVVDKKTLAELKKALQKISSVEVKPDRPSRPSDLGTGPEAAATAGTAADSLAATRKALGIKGRGYQPGVPLATDPSVLPENKRLIKTRINKS